MDELYKNSKISTVSKGLYTKYNCIDIGKKKEIKSVVQLLERNLECRKLFSHEMAGNRNEFVGEKKTSTFCLKEM